MFANVSPLWSAEIHNILHNMKTLACIISLNTMNPQERRLTLV